MTEWTATETCLSTSRRRGGDCCFAFLHEEVRAVPGVVEVDSFVGLRIAKGTFRYTDLGRAGEQPAR